MDTLARGLVGPGWVGKTHAVTTGRRRADVRSWTAGTCRPRLRRFRRHAYRGGRATARAPPVRHGRRWRPDGCGVGCVGGARVPATAAAAAATSAAAESFRSATRTRGVVGRLCCGRNGAVTGCTSRVGYGGGRCRMIVSSVAWRLNNTSMSLFRFRRLIRPRRFPSAVGSVSPGAVRSEKAGCTTATAAVAVQRRRSYTRIRHCGVRGTDSGVGGGGGGAGVRRPLDRSKGVDRRACALPRQVPTGGRARNDPPPPPSPARQSVLASRGPC